MESTFNWYWIVDGLMERGFEVTLAHPFALRAITDARVKTDRRDARMLAQVHRLGAIPRAGRLDAAQWSAERIVSPSADEVMTHPLEQLEVRQHRERYAWFTEQIDALECAVVPEAKAVDADYKLVKRFAAEGVEGLTDRDRSRAAKTHPNATSAAVSEALIELRRKHPKWGPKKLVVLLRKRFRNVPAPSTAGEILKRAGLVAPRKWRPRSERAFSKPFARAAAPNDIWCADFKGHFKTADGAMCKPLTISDAFSRYLIACKAVARFSHECAEAVFTRAFREYGSPSVIRTDNGPPFCASSGLASLSRLSVWWLKLGVLPERIEPGKPQQNARHERMHLTLKQATASPPGRSVRAQQRAFDNFRQEFNLERPHEGIDFETPSHRYCESPRPYPKRVPEPEYPEHFIRRTVTTNGALHFEGHYVYLSRALIGEDVGFEQVDETHWEVHFGPVILGELNAETGKVLCYQTLRVSLDDGA